MKYLYKDFLKNSIHCKSLRINYYLSPLLLKYNFTHAFFTKNSSEIKVDFLSDSLSLGKINCKLSQIHSNLVTFGSESNISQEVNADGLVSDELNQNLWIYTADCMPILFADKKKRNVAALHCGRAGLEKNVIGNILRKFDSLGSSRMDILVAIGPSISKENYLVDKNTSEIFYENINSNLSDTKEELLTGYLQERYKNSSFNTHLFPIDIKKHAQIQLLAGKISNDNIEISSKCTFNSSSEFHSWRKNKTTKRQWNFISS